MSRKRQERKARKRRRVQEAMEQGPMDEQEPVQNETEEQAEIEKPRKEIEIRQAGLAIDVPFEAPAPLKPGEGIRYTDGKTLKDAHRERFPDFYKDEDDASSSET